MKKQHELNHEQQAAVAVEMVVHLNRAMISGTGDQTEESGETPVPIAAGQIRNSVSGDAWGSWDGGKQWRILVDSDTEGDAEGNPYAYSVVCDDDGRPLGTPTGGPLIISHRPSGRGRYLLGLIGGPFIPAENIIWGE